MEEYDNEISEETIELLEQIRSDNTIITVHCPHLDDALQPVPELVDIKTCPNGLDGQCGKCEHYVGMYSPSGTIFAFMQFEGFCDSKNQEPVVNVYKGADKPWNLE